MSSYSLTCDEGGSFSLSGQVGYATVEALLAEGSQLFTGQRDVVVDLAGVERADSAGVALLVEWLRQASTREVSLQYCNVPEQMMSIIEVSDLSDSIPLTSAK